MFLHFIVTLLWHADFHPFVPTILACWHDHKGENHPSLVISSSFRWQLICAYFAAALWEVGGRILLHNVAVNADPSETRVSYERLLTNSYSSWFFSLVDTFLLIHPLLSQTESVVCHSWKDFWNALVHGNLFIGYLQVNCQMDFLLIFLAYGFNYGWEKYIQGFYGKKNMKQRDHWED